MLFTSLVIEKYNLVPALSYTTSYKHWKKNGEYLSYKEM